MSVHSREIWPLLGAQQGIWFAQSADPASTAYSISDCLDIHGPVDPDLVRAAHSRVEQEAQALRLRFAAGDEGPVQYLDESASSALHYLDVSAEQDPVAAAETWMAADGTRPVRLPDDPLCTTALFRTAPDHHILYRRVHHLLLDGWSLALLHNRTAAVYTALARNRPVDDTPFLPWRTLLEDETEYRSLPRLGRDRTYWVERLRGHQDPVRLTHAPAAASRPAHRRRAAVAPRTLGRLREVAETLGVARQDLLLAVTAAYTVRMTAAREIVLGVPLTARLGRNQRDVPGMTTNGLPIPLAVDPDGSLAELAHRTQAAVREAGLHSRYRSEDLIRELGLIGTRRSLWGPVVNIMDFPYDLGFDGHPATVRNVSRTAVDDLSVTFFRTSSQDRMELLVDAHPDRYGPAEVEAHLERLLFLLDSAARADWHGTPLSELPLTSPAERERVLAWARGPECPIADVSVHGMVEKWAARTPQAPALEFEDRVLSFAEVNGRANRLARRLAAAGVGAGHRVAFALTRSADLHVAALGVLKTGAAFVPLDPSYPLPRLAFMVDDAKPTLVLLHSATAHLGPALGTEYLRLDDPEVVRELRELPDHDLTEDETGGFRPDQPAYVIYTSGSTGVPKGVVVPHRGVVNLTAAYVDRLDAGPGTRTLQFVSSSFDAFVGEMTQSLFNGGTLVGAPAERLVPGPELTALIGEKHINDLVLPPSALEVMAPEDMPPGVIVSVVGEACKPTVVERWAPVCRLFNGYGPTETTVATAMSEQLEPAPPAGIPPIGRPLRNVRTYVLDARLEPVPTGAVGQLYVAGAGVTAGYLGRDDLTAERFLEDAFGPPGARMYRTGDLARWTADGELVFVGRDDDQVKVRGFRIELGEVETALARCPGVAQAAAAVHDGEQGDRRLVGYVVAEPGARPDPAGLRQRLADELPAHLTPHLVTVVDALPRTLSGKLDRKALPAPVVPSAAAARRRMPRTATEEILAGLFAETLGLPQVGIDDSFFDLGGHSLSATRLRGRVRRRLGAQVSVRDLFEAPSVAGLARRLQKRSKPDDEVLVPLRPAGDEPPLFCVHPASGQCWGYLRLAGYLPPDLPLYGLQARAAEHPAHRAARVEEMAAEYVAAVRTVQPHGPYRLLGWSFGGLVAHAMATLLQSRGEEVELLALLDCYPRTDTHMNEPLTEDGALRALLRYFDVTALAPPDGRLTPRLVTEALQTHGGQLQHFEESDTASMMRMFQHTSELACDFTPGTFDGDALFFAAALDRPAGAPVPDAWRSHVSGRLVAHALESRHDDLLHPAPLERIATVIDNALRPDDAPRHQSLEE
ncbi:amino acid adenylation domain-containing protein [Streptomyces sp. NPDC048417]|uniref:amino acid adenylation domain-containing protein n=1 Tax=Streptomyces sp. NPDC048417 TaxID=3155387 RepID=UPI00343C40FF